MIIQVLGPGCSRCKNLYEIVTRAVQETGVDALVEKVEDIQKIMAFEILMTPGLVIDGFVKVAGRVPSLEEVKKLILAAKSAMIRPHGPGGQTFLSVERTSTRPIMPTDHPTEKVLVVPCSGIGKVHGLISREAVYRVTDTLMPEQAETLCLALLVTGDPAARQMVQRHPCIAVDGCPKLCAEEHRAIGLEGGTRGPGV